MPIHTSWKPMLMGMRKTYCGQSTSGSKLKFADGTSVVVCEKAEQVFFATVNKMKADDTKPRPKKVQESIEQTPNFIRVRVENPKKFIRFRIKVLGKGIKAVMGFLKEGGSRIQSVLFPRNKYTLAQAKAWVKKHGYTVEETYWVHDIIIDPKTVELYFEETIAKDEDEVGKVDIEKINEDEFEWLIT